MSGSGRSRRFHLDPSSGAPMHSLGLIHRWTLRRRRSRSVVAAGAPTVGACEQNFPPSDCSDGSVQTRIPNPTARNRMPAPDPSQDPDDDPNSLLPRWLPGGVPGSRLGDPDACRSGPCGRDRVGGGSRSGGADHDIHPGARPAGAGDVGQTASGRTGFGNSGQVPGRRRAPARCRPALTGRWWSAWSAWCTLPGWSPWRRARGSPMRCRPPAVRRRCGHHRAEHGPPARRR